MKIKRGNKVIICIVSVILIIVLFISVVPWGVMFGISLFLPNPLKPKIKYAEFSFTLVYEIDGEKKIVKDTLICEYDGIEINTGQGKVRKWKQSFASGKSKILLKEEKNVKSIYEFSPPVIYREIYHDPGSASYYMGDGDEDSVFPAAAFYEETEEDRKGEGAGGCVEKEELLEKFGIKLISWDCDSPIENVFE